jgi:protein-S-isoprenylcysteine O-methyltransferase Ste14
VLFPVGYALVGQRVMAFVGVALYVVVMHLTVLVEEEHLERCFGDEYRRYKERTPRYFLF